MRNLFDSWSRLASLFELKTSLYSREKERIFQVRERSSFEEMVCVCVCVFVLGLRGIYSNFFMLLQYPLQCFLLFATVHNLSFCYRVYIVTCRTTTVKIIFFWFSLDLFYSCSSWANLNVLRSICLCISKSLLIILLMLLWSISCSAVFWFHVSQADTCCWLFFEYFFLACSIVLLGFVQNRLSMLSLYGCFCMCCSMEFFIQYLG